MFQKLMDETGLSSFSFATYMSQDVIPPVCVLNFRYLCRSPNAEKEISNSGNSLFNFIYRILKDARTMKVLLLFLASYASHTINESISQSYMT